MYNHSVTTHLPWSSSPMVLYQQAALSRKEDENTARFGGAFSIRSILSQTRSQAESMGSTQDHRYLGNVPCSFSQPQVVCCNEGGTTMHLQREPIHVRTSIQNQEANMVTQFETTKLQGIK